MDKASAQGYVRRALQEGRPVLSEYESKQLIAAYQIPVTREILIHDKVELAAAVRSIGYPLALKGVSDTLVHKTEHHLVKLNIHADDEASKAFDSIVSAMGEEGSAVLVQEMVYGSRELVIGLTRDPQFGPCVMFGLGGIFTEILRDVTFRKAPLEKQDAVEMMQEIRGNQILGETRGMEAADTDKIAEILITVGQIGLEMQEIAAIDLNPLILAGKNPVVVDALVVLRHG